MYLRECTFSSGDMTLTRHTVISFPQRLNANGHSFSLVRLVSACSVKKALLSYNAAGMLDANTDGLTEVSAQFVCVLCTKRSNGREFISVCP
jgi:hypothetical protein